MPVHVIPKGSLVAKDVKIVDEAGAVIEADGVHKLCRCGRSKEKPFCDDTHTTFDWRTDKDANRTPNREGEYEGADITVLDDRGTCAHTGYCTDHLPAVWDNSKEPWIEPDGAPPEDIAETIRHCPSGALAYRRDGKVVDAFDSAAEIEVAAAGPFRMHGGVDLKDPNGERPRSADHYTLCRCGHSKNKPFCDGTHWYVNFGHRGPATTAASETDGYVDMGAVDDFTEGEPSVVEVDGAELVAFRLWGRVCAVAAKHGERDMRAAQVVGGQLVAEGMGYTPYPWKRAPEDDLPVHDVMVVDGRAFVSLEPVPHD